MINNLNYSILIGSDSWSFKGPDIEVEQIKQWSSRSGDELGKGHQESTDDGGQRFGNVQSLQGFAPLA